MSDDNKVLTPDEVKAKVIEDFGFDENEDAERIEKLTNERIENQKSLSTAIRQKVEYRKKLTDALGDEGQPDGEPKKTNQQPNYEERLERLELKEDGYLDDEIEHLMSMGGKKALANPIIAKSIEAIRNERKAQDAIPDNGSGNSPIFQKKTAEDINNMSVAELEKILPRAEK